MLAAFVASVVLGALACGEGALATPASTRLGFWNVRKLGQDPAKDVPSLCALIHREFDVLVLAEVMAEDTTGDVAALRACLGAEFQLLATESPRPRGSGPHREQLWLLVRPSHARPCAGTFALTYAPAPLGSPTGDTTFLRPPAFACLRLHDGSSLQLGGYHARWGSGEPSEVAREIGWLDEVLDAAAAAVPGAAAVLLGDLNLPPAAVADATGLAVHTRGAGSTLSPSGEPTAHLYDQLLIAPQSALALGDARPRDLRADVGGPSAYHRRISDHLPIVALLGGVRGASEDGQEPEHVP